MISEGNNRPCPCLALLGTGSDVGKSVLVTGLCRYFADRGVKVAPFKAQNMSNNAGVTPEGLEMGRAQIVQAEAARIPPHVDMNPVLLKPTSDIGAQVVLMGKSMENATAAEFHHKKASIFATAAAALDRLRWQYDLVIMEGAGSCAEVNLMSHDIVNFKMAEHADAPVILVADIHRGGVFAQIVGTLACLPPDKIQRVAGFVVNRFRGDLTLFEDGIDWLEKKTARSCFGVVPWFTDFQIEQEDSVVIEQPEAVSITHTDNPSVAVIRIPHISNFTDFDPLSRLEGLDVYFVEQCQDLSSFAGVILPGSKNTCFDLQWLQTTGWAEELNRFAENNGAITGICGGYQMMGQTVNDPDGLEGPPGRMPGLGLLPIDTTLSSPKTTTWTRFSYNGAEGIGYEIHMGHTRRLAGLPLLTVLARNGRSISEEDGTCSENSRLMGTYIHGFFDSAAVTREWLDKMGLKQIAVSGVHGPASRDRDYDQLAAHLTGHMDLAAIEALLWKKTELV